MAKVLIDGVPDNIKINHWAEKRGDCDRIICQPHRDCNYEGSKKKCISQLVGHACKHYVKAVKIEKSKVDQLMKEEEICNPSDDRKKGIHILSTDTLLDVRNKNAAVRDYDELCKRSELRLLGGKISKGNIQLACGKNYKGYTVILNSDQEILSFYYSKSLEKNPSRVVGDFCMYNVMRNTMEQTAEKSRSKQYCYFYSDTVASVKCYVVPVEGELFHEMFDGMGIGSKIEYAFRFRGNMPGDWDNTLSIMFHYYFDPEVAKDIIEVHKALSKLKEYGEPTEKMINVIMENENSIITMLKLQHYEVIFGEMQVEHSFEEIVYSAAYNGDQNHKITQEMLECIGKILLPGMEDDLSELTEEYLKIRYPESDPDDIADGETKDDLLELRRDVLSFEIAQREKEISLLKGYLYHGDIAPDHENDPRLGNDIEVIRWRELMNML